MKKKLLMIGTGGTIASSPTDNGLAPTMNSEELLSEFHNIQSLCTVDCKQAFCLDSTNIRPKHWLLLVKMIKENYDAYDGFVITHGTDTMAYTAAGLSYLIQNSPKPIVLTGAQKPIKEEGTDAKQNLLDALLYACDEKSHGIVIIFSGSVICGTRARKNYSKRFMAFGSVNFPELARVQDHRIIRYVTETCEGSVRFYDKINPNVGILKLTPGMNDKMMHYAVEIYDGLVIESFGVGGLPEYSDFYSLIMDAQKRGKVIVMTTQVPNEGSDLQRYRVGNMLKDGCNILEAFDMTSEAALTKMMWILGQTTDFSEIEELFYYTINYDILCV